MDLAAVMDALGSAVDPIPGLRVFPYWADRVQPPAVVVGWPEPLTYDATMMRGCDRVTMPMIVLVGRIDSRTARNLVAKYAAGSGESSIKQRVEAHETTAYQSARVTQCTFGAVTVAGTEYLAATFDIDVIGQGS